MRKQFLIILLLVSVSKMNFAQETLADKVRHAFSLVGHWEIIKMDVIRASTLTNPGTVPEATMGTVSVLISSELGSYGSFDVATGGNITGSGEAQYNYHVSAGSTGLSIPMTNMVLPVGASAMMNGDNGVRKFSISGSADLVKRVIKLNAFKPEGDGLKMIIHPGGNSFTAVLWPPMTNVETDIIVTGASLLLRATGVLSGIKVSFEAVKYVDLASLFTAIQDLVKNGTNGANGTNGTNGNNGNTGNNGNNGTNGTNGNNGNTGNNGNNGNNGTNGTSGNNGNNSNNGANNQGPQALVAGSITVEIGSSANVVFKIPQANANYAIGLAPMNGPNAQTVATFSGKTPLGFKIYASKSGSASGTIKVDWVVTPYTN
jgi:hypothetical protein